MYFDDHRLMIGQFERNARHRLLVNRLINKFWQPGSFANSVGIFRLSMLQSLQIMAHGIACKRKTRDSLGCF